MRANFLETNPVPVKTALELMGHLTAYFRLPLVPLGSERREELKVALQKAGLL
jgi:4-hydroxy-tetrahydrodipicolinate synthase